MLREMALVQAVRQVLEEGDILPLGQEEAILGKIVAALGQYDKSSESSGVSSNAKCEPGYYRIGYVAPFDFEMLEDDEAL